MLEFLTRVEFRQQGDARGKGGRIENCQSCALFHTVAPRYGDGTEPDEKGGEHRSEKRVPLTECSREEYPQRNAWQHRVRQRGN